MMRFCQELLFLSILCISASASRLHVVQGLHNGNTQDARSSVSSNLTRYDCDAQLTSCKAMHNAADNEHKEKCELRGDACTKGSKYFGKYGFMNEPCSSGTWAGFPAQFGSALSGGYGADGGCADTRELTKIFLNPMTFNDRTADDALKTFIYQEVVSTLSLIACEVHASFQGIAKKFQAESLSRRGLADSVSLANRLTQLASIALPVGAHVAAAANIMALAYLRSLWFNQVGSELIGMKFQVSKDPMPHPMNGCAAPRLEAREMWEITGIQKFDDAAFPQYLPGVIHHVLECVSGTCADKEGNPTPPVLVSLQGSLERAAQSALILASKQLGVSHEESEGAFQAFLAAAAGAAGQAASLIPAPTKA